MENIHIGSDQLFKEFKEYITNSGNKLIFNDSSISTKDFNISFSDTYKAEFDKLKIFNNELIYGKNNVFGIVAVEVVNNSVQLFFSDGTSKAFKYRHWLLSNKPLSDKITTRLEGNLTYKYIAFFDSEEELNQFFFKNKNRYDLYRCYNPREAAMLLHGLTLFKGLTIEDVSVLSFDIESAGLTRDRNSKVFLITNTFVKNGICTKKHFRLDQYENDGVMIEKWCDWVREVNPDIILGHNIFGYDLPYLDHVASLNGKQLCLGRYGEPIEFKFKDSEYRVDGNSSWSYKKSHIFGRQIIDGMFLAVKYDFGRKYDSWGLKQIAQQEGLIDVDRQFYDASKINQNWNDPVEREKIVAYGIADSDDSYKLYKLMIPSYFYTCQSLPKPFEEMMQGATGSWINFIVMRSYLQQNHSIPKANDHSYVHGGISFGNPGLYKNVIKLDVSSLYPSCILTYNIYPKEKDPKQNFLTMVRFFTEARLSAKKIAKQTGDKYYDDLQASYKVTINSSFGTLGTPGLNFNDFDAANEITRRGRIILRKSIAWASGKDVDSWFSEYDKVKDNVDNIFDIYDGPTYDFIISNGDTDAISFCKKDMSDFSDEEFIHLNDELNSVMDKGINFEDDGYYEKFLIVAAKNYCLLEKGSTKIKKKGSSLLDSKKEPILRDFMGEMIDSLIYEKANKTEIYEKYVNEACNITDISRWAVKKSVSKKLLNGTRANETKVLDAIGDLSTVKEGDKIWIYNSIDGVRQQSAKGELLFYKDGRPKMELNNILKVTKNWAKDEDKLHYVERVYKTLQIFTSVLDLSQFIDYTRKDNFKILEERFNIKFIR